MARCRQSQTSGAVPEEQARGAREKSSFAKRKKIEGRGNFLTGRPAHRLGLQRAESINKRERREVATCAFERPKRGRCGSKAIAEDGAITPDTSARQCAQIVADANTAGMQVVVARVGVGLELSGHLRKRRRSWAGHRTEEGFASPFRSFLAKRVESPCRGTISETKTRRRFYAAHREEAMTPRVQEILSWYESENVGVRTNLARILNHGTLAGTGRAVILPVDQGFEHGPARSFAANPAGYDPRTHFRLAIEAGCNAHAAPLGALRAAAAGFAGEIPLILKLNNHDLLHEDADPISALTGSVNDALQLGCVAVGFTIYPGSERSQEIYEELREVTEEARDAGLAVVVWSYPRGSGLSKEGETALDVVAYAAQIAAQMGAHIIKVKLPPSDHIELPEARKVYEAQNIPRATLPERVRHIVQSSFDGRRIVIFSGGVQIDTPTLLEDARAIRDGGGFGSIVGRNSFQRPHEEAVALLRSMMEIYAA